MSNHDSTPNDAHNEEPEIVQEESVPSDGKDVEGEKMMEELGGLKGDRTSEKPAQ